MLFCQNPSSLPEAFWNGIIIESVLSDFWQGMLVSFYHWCLLCTAFPHPYACPEVAVVCSCLYFLPKYYRFELWLLCISWTVFVQITPMTQFSVRIEAFIDTLNFGYPSRIILFIWVRSVLSCCFAVCSILSNFVGTFEVTMTWILFSVLKLSFTWIHVNSHLNLEFTIYFLILHCNILTIFSKTSHDILWRQSRNKIFITSPNTKNRNDYIYCFFSLLFFHLIYNKFEYH